MKKMKRTFQVILVPHPGGEAKVQKGGACPWPKDDECNKGKHSRKFLRAQGNWHSKANGNGSGKLVFWGEYEASTKAELLTIRSEQGGPKYVHSIAKTDSEGRGMLNTDPWVFWPGFIWSICRRKQIEPGEFHEAHPGEIPTIVLFGSVVAGNWLLDTVLAVKGELSSNKLISNRAFRTMVMNPLRSQNITLRPIAGHTFEAREYPFSFVPAMPVRGGEIVTFARPNISCLVEGLIMQSDCNPASRKNSQSLTKCWAGPTFWKELLAAVETSKPGLVLATSIIIPTNKRGAL